MNTPTRIIKNPVVYKVLIDIIVLSLVFVGGFIVAETVLPGALRAYISPFILFCTIYLLFICSVVFARAQHIAHTPQKNTKIFFFFSLAIFGMCCGLSGFRFGLLFTTLATLLCVSIYAMIYGVVHEEISKHTP